METYFIVLVVAALVGLTLLVALMFRNVVSPNEVHIVQNKGKRVAYGNVTFDGKTPQDKDVVKGRNAYYNWPTFLPIIGNVVTKLPISIFPITLSGYEAYDMDKVPFSVDIFAQFTITDPVKAAQKISSFEELKHQLQSVLQGVVRATLSTKGVEEIMIARKDLGEAFLEEANSQVSEYGVVAIYLEFMNIEDASESSVISNIQAKRESSIRMESRVEVAANDRTAEVAEIEAKRDAAVADEQAKQKVGERVAEKDQAVGVANEKAQQKIQIEAATTAEKEMDVKRVLDVRNARIAKDVQVVAAEQQKETEVIKADGEKQKVSLHSEGILTQEKNRATGIEAVGVAEGEALKAKELAPVQAKITLAEAIASLPEYIEYLLGIEGFSVQKDVGVEKARALQAADIQIISTGDADKDTNGVLDMLSAKGGSKIGAMIESFEAVTGKKVSDLFKPKKNDTQKT